MIRLLSSLARMLAMILAVLTVAYCCGAKNFPLIAWVSSVGLLSFGWCGWLWFRGYGWKWRLLVTTAFGVVVSGLSCFLYGDYLISLMGGRHIGPQEDPLSKMAHLSDLEGTGLVLVGILLMTYADYQRPAKLTQLSALAKDEGDESASVWPPAPKRSE